jgi:hypothetical protein
MTLSINNLSASKELDRAALCAVRGGEGNQANGTSQLNVQSMIAAANVGNGLVVGPNSPVIIQSDNTFTQDADNSNTAVNDKSLLALLISRF